MPGHSQHVLDPCRQFVLRQAFVKLFGYVQKHRIELPGSAADAFDLVQRLDGARSSQSHRTIDDFCLGKIFRGLLIGSDRQDVQFEANGLTGVGDQSRQFGIGLQGNHIANCRFRFRSFDALAHRQERLAFAWKPQNPGLQGAGQVVLIDILQNDQRVTIHESTYSRPPPL